MLLGLRFLLGLRVGQPVSAKRSRLVHESIPRNAIVRHVRKIHGLTI